MLLIFDVIEEAYCKHGHLGQDKTLDGCKPTYYSLTQELVQIFSKGCNVYLEKQPVVPPCMDAKKPIISSVFRNRFQVDLVDMRAQRKPDVHGLIQRWIMTVKDHLTGLIYLAALPRKKAVYVAQELEKYFVSFYPQIFHTDNGKEFVANTMVQQLKQINPHCFVVTVQPRTP
jgi:hypothetical protein